jgi:archaemetzincin
MKCEEKIIAVQPLGRVREDVLRIIAANLEAFFQIQTRVFPDRSIPPEAHDPRRGQYNCYPLLAFLERSKAAHAVKVMGVIEADLFIPILTHVFGEAQMGGAATVISTYRPSRGKDCQAVSLDLFLERMAKIAIHEMAHTFRLVHCREDGCLMASFPVLGRIDETPARFCRYCSTFLRDEYENAGIPWEKPKTP